MVTASPVLHHGEYALHTEQNITDIINENRKILAHVLRYLSSSLSFFIILPQLSFRVFLFFSFYVLDKIGAKRSCESWYEFLKCFMELLFSSFSFLRLSFFFFSCELYTFYREPKYKALFKRQVSQQQVVIELRTWVIR